jgi:hypothetical protein
MSRRAVAREALTEPECYSTPIPASASTEQRSQLAQFHQHYVVLTQGKILGEQSSGMLHHNLLNRRPTGALAERLGLRARELDSRPALDRSE